MNIKEMWKEAGGTFETGNQHDWPHARIDSPIAFAELVAAHEREECAKLCDGLADMHEKMNQWGQFKTAETLTQAIRARGKA
jgi:hypothetical protein